MQAAVLRQLGGPFTVEEVELLAPGPGEVRVRLAAAGGLLGGGERGGTGAGEVGLRASVAEDRDYS